MPLIKVETTVVLTDEKRSALLAALSKIGVETIGKPEDYFMVNLGQCAFMMSGKPGEAAFVDVRSIGGLGGDVPKKLSQKICAALHESLGIPPSRIYLNFTEVAARNWGWNASTFG